MLEKIHEVELFKSYHFDDIEVEDSKIIIKASTTQVGRIKNDLEGDGINDVFRKVLGDGENLLSSLFDEIKEGVDKAAAEDKTLEERLTEQINDNATKIDIEQELKTVKEQESPDITFDESATDFIIEAFGWTVKDGIIHDDTGAAHCYTGHPVAGGELAAVVDRDGEPTPLCDNFNCLVEFVADNR